MDVVARRRPVTSSSQPVRVLTVLPADPEGLQLGGIATFVRGFVKFAPDDFQLGFIGLTATRKLWQWQQIVVESRAIQFLPVARIARGDRGRLPLALRFTAALLANRGRVRTHGWILSFHRPATEIPFLHRAVPMWRVVHLSVEDLRTRGSESRWRRLPGLLGALERRTFRRMDRIYVVNEAVTERYRERYSEVSDRFRFLPNWADPTIFRGEPERRRSDLKSVLAAELGIAANGPVILFAGRLDGQKDPLLLARSFALFLERHPSASLAIAGEGALKESTRRELSSLGADQASRFLGSVPRERLAHLMNVASALLITSAFETGPTVGLEALACGLPVVTTRVGEVARLVERTGAGRVAWDRRPQELAGGLDWVISQPGNALRRLCMEAAAPYLADRILGDLYDYNRDLAQRSTSL